MKPKQPSRTPGTKHLSGKQLMLFHYSHMDWAWCFSRAWHVARYTKIFDEALERLASDDSFCFAIDSLAESVLPYFEHRPKAQSAWNGYVRTGRIAIVGGQYVNLRPATAPEELYLRNLIHGHATLARLLPAAKPVGFANLDTAVGHAQLPQIMTLAGMRYMLAGRPELGLERDDCPKMFRWRGLDGSTLLTLVQHYGILCRHLMELADPSPERRQEAYQALSELLDAHARLPVDTSYAFLAHDDTRYMRHHCTDEEIDLQAINKEWTQQTGSTIIQGTPDMLYERLRSQMDHLPLKVGPVDQADVSYNGPFGQSGLRHLRDTVSAALVEAELYHAWNRILSEQPVRPAPLTTAWEDALRGQAHAVQALFRSDIEHMERRLRSAQDAAEESRDKSLNGILPTCLPQDSDRIAVFNPLPVVRRRTVTIPIMRTDLSDLGVRVIGPDGHPLPQQPLAPLNPSRPGEWPILVDVSMPASGYCLLSLEPTDEKPALANRSLPLNGKTEAPPYTFDWHDGMLTAIHGPKGTLTANRHRSLLEPVCRDVTCQGWMTTAIGAPLPRGEVVWLRQTEHGPLRTCVKRCMRFGRVHEVFQRIHAYNDGRLEIMTELAYGPEAGMFTLAMPCPHDADLVASIPFGAEPRELDRVHYTDNGTGDRVIERLVPGMFYARDWVRWSDRKATACLAVLDGDRYWLWRKAEESLEHLLVRTTPPQHDGWVSQTRLNQPGIERVKHRLFPGHVSGPMADRATDDSRFPVRCRPIKAGRKPALQSFFRCTDGSDHVRLLSFRCTAAGVEIRFVEHAGKAGPVTFTWPHTPHRATLVDLHGRPLPEKANVQDRDIRLTVSPWQIRTVRVE